MNKSPRVRDLPTRHILNAGANRGARENLPAFARWAAESTGAPLALTYADPLPGRAEETARRAHALGVQATGLERRAESLLDAEPFTAVVSNVDAPATLARLIASSRSAEIPLLGYMLIELPNRELVGLMLSLRPQDVNSGAIERFASTLAGLTARGGSSAIFGAQARPTHLLAEPELRASFQAHTAGELRRVIADVEAEREPMEFAFANGTTAPVGVVLGETFGEPREVVEAVIESKAVPMERGRSVVVAEVTPTAIRLHDARLRATDGRLAVRAISTIDAATQARLAAEREAAREATEAAREAVALRLQSPSTPEPERSPVPLLELLASMRTDTISTASPVRTTD